jgi:LysM repeat protein
MRSRTPARWLAPLALIFVVGAILLVVNRSDVGSKGAEASTSPGVTGASTTATTTTTPRHGRRTYTVKTNDTLSGIAEKTGVSLDVIEQLNPGLDAQSLHAGQKIKLAP